MVKIRTASANSEESDLGCTSRGNFDNVTLMSQKLCYYNSAVGTRPWTPGFTSAITTIVSSSSQSHMVNPDWIQILRKATPTCMKGKVTVYVTCQCSENSYFWRLSGSVLCSLVHSFNCLVYSAAYNPISQHMTLSCIQCLCRKNHTFLMR